MGVDHRVEDAIGVGEERAVAPFHILAKPIGPMCNLDCTYCFYLEKEVLYPRTSKWAMPDDVLEEYVRQYIEHQKADTIHFAWQGGEPTLLGVDFFRHVVELQAKYAGGKRIENAIQTNGTLLNDEWGSFLHEQKFLVGISIDGPRELHDFYRVDKGNQPTFDNVMRGIDVLKRHEVEFNTLTTVHAGNVYTSSMHKETQLAVPEHYDPSNRQQRRHHAQDDPQNFHRNSQSAGASEEPEVQCDRVLLNARAEILIASIAAGEQRTRMPVKHDAHQMRVRRGATIVARNAKR